MKSDIVNNKFANRIIEIDVLRGICVFLMIFDHAFYDIFGILPVLTNFPIFGKPSYDVYEFAKNVPNASVNKLAQLIINVRIYILSSFPVTLFDETSNSVISITSLEY